MNLFRLVKLRVSRPVVRYGGFLKREKNMEKKEYILGSHNSWSYLRPQRWWQRVIAFTARCQRVDIRRQYELGVRSFDLRLRTDGEGKMWLAHGLVEYPVKGLVDDLEFLDAQGGCWVRVLHETERWRGALATRHTGAGQLKDGGKEDGEKRRADFRQACGKLERGFPHIRFYGGMDVRTWAKEYYFQTLAPTEDGCYASNMQPRVLDDWWPWLYARLHNRKFRKQGTNLDVLVLDFVDM